MAAVIRNTMNIVPFPDHLLVTHHRLLSFLNNFLLLLPRISTQQSTHLFQLLFQLGTKFPDSLYLRHLLPCLWAVVRKSDVGVVPSDQVMGIIKCAQQSSVDDEVKTACIGVLGCICGNDRAGTTDPEIITVLFFRFFLWLILS